MDTVRDVPRGRKPGISSTWLRGCDESPAVGVRGAQPCGRGPRWEATKASATAKLSPARHSTLIQWCKPGGGTKAMTVQPAKPKEGGTTDARRQAATRFGTAEGAAATGQRYLGGGHRVQRVPAVFAFPDREEDGSSVGEVRRRCRGRDARGQRPRHTAQRLPPARGPAARRAGENVSGLRSRLSVPAPRQGGAGSAGLPGRRVLKTGRTQSTDRCGTCPPPATM